MPSLKAFKKGKNIVLTTEDSTMDVFFEHLERCKEDDGMCLLNSKDYKTRSFWFK